MPLGQDLLLIMVQSIFKAFNSDHLKQGRLAWNKMAYKIANNYDEKGLGALVGVAKVISDFLIV